MVFWVGGREGERERERERECQDVHSVKKQNKTETYIAFKTKQKSTKTKNKKQKAETYIVFMLPWILLLDVAALPEKEMVSFDPIIYKVCVDFVFR